MTRNFESVPLREVCQVDKQQGENFGLRYVGLEDIESGTGRFLGSSMTCKVKSSTFRFSDKHVLYGRLRPYLNKVYLPDFDGHCSTEIFPLRPSDHLLREYLSYWLMSDSVVRSINDTSTGARMPRANISAILDFQIPLPTMAEQKRIVAKLDEALEAINRAKENADKNVANAQALLHRRIELLFSNVENEYDEIQVREILKSDKGSIRTGPFGSQLLHSEFIDSGIAVLGIDNVVSNEFRWGKPRFIAEAKYRQLERYRVFPGDVLITIMGTCGRCAVVPDDIPIAINTKHICCITLDRGKCLPEFLYLYFLYAKRAGLYLAQKAKGSIMAGLNMQIIRELPVTLPPINIQQKIIDDAQAFKSEAMVLKDVYLRKSHVLVEFKASVLDHAFAGQL